MELRGGSGWEELRQSMLVDTWCDDDMKCVFVPSAFDLNQSVSRAFPSLPVCSVSVSGDSATIQLAVVVA